MAALTRLQGRGEKRAVSSAPSAAPQPIKRRRLEHGGNVATTGGEAINTLAESRAERDSFGFGGSQESAVNLAVSLVDQHRARHVTVEMTNHTTTSNFHQAMRSFQSLGWGQTNQASQTTSNLQANLAAPALDNMQAMGSFQSLRFGPSTAISSLAKVAQTSNLQPMDASNLVGFGPIPAFSGSRVQDNPPALRRSGRIKSELYQNNNFGFPTEGDMNLATPNVTVPTRLEALDLFAEYDNPATMSAQLDDQIVNPSESPLNQTTNKMDTVAYGNPITAFPQRHNQIEESSSSWSNLTDRTMTASNSQTRESLNRPVNRSRTNLSLGPSLDTTIQKTTPPLTHPPPRQAANVNPKFHLFLLLPLELRLQIYKTILASAFKHHQYPLYNGSPSSTHLIARVLRLQPETNKLIEIIRNRTRLSDPIDKNALSILRTCKQIYDEAEMVLYDCTLFIVQFCQTQVLNDRPGGFELYYNNWKNVPVMTPVVGRKMDRYTVPQKLHLEKVRHLSITTNLIPRDANGAYIEAIRNILSLCSWDDFGNMRSLSLRATVSGNLMDHRLPMSGWNMDANVEFYEGFGEILRDLEEKRGNRRKRDTLVVDMTNAFRDVEGMKKMVGLKEELEGNMVINVAGTGPSAHWG